MQQVILLGMMVALVPTAILLFLDDGGGDEEARARKQSFGRRSRAAHAAGHQQRLAVRDEPSMARPLLAGGDVEQGPPHASDASEAGYNRSMNDEQNLDGFDNLSDRSIGTRASAGPSSLEVSPARPEPVAATASPSNPDCPSPPEPLSGRNSGIPRSPFLLSPEDSAASLDPGPTTHVSSHALEIADVLSDTSAASGTPSSTAARRGTNRLASRSWGLPVVLKISLSGVAEASEHWGSVAVWASRSLSAQSLRTGSLQVSLRLA